MKLCRICNGHIRAEKGKFCSRSCYIKHKKTKHQMMKINNSIEEIEYTSKVDEKGYGEIIKELLKGNYTLACLFATIIIFIVCFVIPLNIWWLLTVGGSLMSLYFVYLIMYL